MIDCVIVGINEQSFDAYAKGQATFRERSGSFEEVFTNSIFIDDSYYNSIELMTWLLNQVDSKNWALNVFETPNLGVYYLASYLKKRNITVKIINHYNSGKDKLSELIRSGARSIAITTTFYVTDDPIIEIVRYVRSIDKTVSVIIGGPRIYEICTSYPISKRDVFLKKIGADFYIVDSQGEASLHTLISALKQENSLYISNIPNIISLKNKKLVTTKRAKENNSISENATDWSLFDCDEYGQVVYMRTARGCLYSCSYCTYPKFAGKYECSTIDSVEREMDQLHVSGVKYIIFIDDSFNVPLERFKDLCEMMIRKKYNFQWLSFFRCIKIEEAVIELMKRSGCLGVYLGIESLNQLVLKNMRKGNIDYLSCIELLDKYEILTLGSFIIGFPGETEESVKETINVFNTHPTTFYNPQLYYHSLLTPINDRAEEFNLEGHSYAWSHSTMSWKEAIYWKNHMIKSIDSSILLPLYSSGIWSLPYLIEQGISTDFFIEYTKFVAGLIKDNVNGALKTKEEVLQEFKKLKTIGEII